jgi:hypothetical protein
MMLHTAKVFVLRRFVYLELQNYLAKKLRWLMDGKLAFFLGFYQFCIEKVCFTKKPSLPLISFSGSRNAFQQ